MKDSTTPLTPDLASSTTSSTSSLGEGLDLSSTKTSLYSELASAFSVQEIKQIEQATISNTTSLDNNKPLSTINNQSPITNTNEINANNNNLKLYKKVIKEFFLFLMDLSFMIGDALFLVGCVCFLKDEVALYKTASWCFVVGSMFCIIASLSKIITDIILISNVVNNLTNQKEDITPDSNKDKESNKLRNKAMVKVAVCIVEVLVSMSYLVGGLTFMAGSIIYVICDHDMIPTQRIAESIWIVGTVCNLFSTICQTILFLIFSNEKRHSDPALYFISIFYYICNFLCCFLYFIGAPCFVFHISYLSLVGNICWIVASIILWVGVVIYRIFWLRRLAKKTREKNIC